MKKISFEPQKSVILRLDTRIVVAIPFLLLVIYRLVNSAMFMFQVEAIEKLDLFTQMATFLSAYINYVDLIFAVLPLFYILFEHKSLLIRFHSFEYLIINLFIPLLYVLVIGMTLLIPSLKNIIYLMSVISLFGLLQVILTIIQVFILNDIVNNRTSAIPFISKIALKLSKI